MRRALHIYDNAAHGIYRSVQLFSPNFSFFLKFHKISIMVSGDYCVMLVILGSILCYVVLYIVVLRCLAFRSIALQCAMHCTVRHCHVLHSTALHCAVPVHHLSWYMSKHVRKLTAFLETSGKYS